MLSFEYDVNMSSLGVCFVESMGDEIIVRVSSGSLSISEPLLTWRFKVAMTASRGGGPDQGPSQPQQRRIMRTQTVGNLGESFDSQVVPSLLVEIAPILRVANEVGSMRSRKLTGWIPPPVEEVFGSLRLHSYSVLKENMILH
ncbi:uncharacterized protein LOC106366580 isoform X3 [Brassica napus]|uniref:uncharacterized protein LOC106366580 isoform X3 n=1 Tax=Brassica napus TaxID=3708 RepID=UPI0004F1C327|nr:uncharacterized protein LOC106366580 isoform X3 [Brassica napus]